MIQWKYPSGSCLCLFLKFSKKKNVFHLFNGSIKQRNKFKRECHLHETFYFQWLQLIDSIPERWKFIVKENYENVNKGSRAVTLDKLTSTEIYSLLISKAQNKRSSNIFFKNRCNDYNIDWTAISMLPRLVTYNTFMRSFKYKILNNVLFLNEKLHTFWGQSRIQG